MSEAKHLDISLAHLKGKNKSVVCGVNVQIEPSSDERIHSENDRSVPSVDFGSSGERKPIYENNGLRKSNGNGRSVMSWGHGECLGDCLNMIQTAGHKNVINELTPGKSLDAMGRVDEKGKGFGPTKCSNGASACKNNEIERLSLGKSNHTYVGEECDSQVSIGDLSKNSGESISHAPCHESQSCEASRLILTGELSGTGDIDKINRVIPKTLIENLIPVENSVELPGKVNLQDESVTASFGQRFGSKPSVRGQEEGFNLVGSFNHPAVFQKGSTAKGNIVEGLFEYDYGSRGVDLNKPVHSSDVVLECITSERVSHSSKFDKMTENRRKSTDGSYNGELSEHRGFASDDMKVEQIAEFDIGVPESSPADGAQRTLVKEVMNSHRVVENSSCSIEKDKSNASDFKNSFNKRAGSVSDEITAKLQIVVIGCPANAIKSKRGRKPGKSSAATTGIKYLQPPLVDSTRALRPRSQHTSDVPELSNNVENKRSSTGRRRGRRKKTEIEGESFDEFLRIRNHLRYLFHRIRYEQNLLDAYSSEGWRGQSLEKLRPEKELQRAKTDINRSKLKIRNLFQHLDSLSAEGRFPDSLFDSEGLIDSEDIFCAKCGSKELSVNNDIILCDGACNRGFHQFCLEPPLHTEEIPPGDEGWLCPACECKLDCLCLLNDTQGTKLSVMDSWEKVFPDIVASLAGNEHDHSMGLPSDDSEDNDYNPEGADNAKAGVSGSNSNGSDSSDFSSASEDLGDVGGGQHYVGLPSDDSEGDDFDPNGANVDQNPEQESSGSDFTSASEDLGATVHNDGTQGDDEPSVPLLGPDEDTADSPPVSGRRHIERLDYKKLYNETYGNASSDSSDDEEWTDMVLYSSIGKASTSAEGSCSAHAPQRRGRKKLNLQVANGSAAQLVKSSEKTSVRGRGPGRPPNRLGEAVTWRLYESFKENQYPDRFTKEKLAKELGLTPTRVDRWFGNTRWSFNHHPTKLEASMAAVASLRAPSNVLTRADSALADANAPISESLDVTESGKSEPIPRTSRKKRDTEEFEPIPECLNTETPKEVARNDSLQYLQDETDTMQFAVIQHGSQQKRRKSDA